mmetsp:Transcript_2008/g.12814  ORF Transcript_2008/g.12814 Transcript_2008/m.12814 type:complete len:233 (-) Transcript_2008:103-801(-)
MGWIVGQSATSCFWIRTGDLDSDPSLPQNGRVGVVGLGASRRLVWSVVFEFKFFEAFGSRRTHLFFHACEFCLHELVEYGGFSFHALHFLSLRRRPTTFVRDVSSVPRSFRFGSCGSYRATCTGHVPLGFLLLRARVCFHPFFSRSWSFPSRPFCCWSSAVERPRTTHLGLFEDHRCVVQRDGFAHRRTTCCGCTSCVCSGQLAVAVRHEFGRRHRHGVVPFRHVQSIRVRL